MHFSYADFDGKVSEAYVFKSFLLSFISVIASKIFCFLWLYITHTIIMMIFISKFQGWTSFCTLS